MAKKYDFTGWASRNDLKCSDGRTIRKDAFKECDGQIVPMVWNHQHNDSDNVLGHALLENRPEGIYCYCSFNDTEKGQNAKLLVQHGDITGLSIYANKLKQVGGDVLHGVIREVSLVLAGANPGAFIDSVMAHGDGSEEEAVIYTGEELDLEHTDPEDEEQEDTSDEDENEDEEVEEETDEVEHSDKEKNEMPENKEKTVQDVIDTMNEEQKNVMYALIGEALDNSEGNEEGDENMKHNVFENDENYNENVLSHSDLEAIAADVNRYGGSLKETFLAHGIDHLDYLVPEYKNVRGEIPFINTQPAGWINTVLNGVHHTPFAKVKMVFADITMDTARAKGYIKGTQKVDEIFNLIKREVAPTTIYKKQSFDRDDVIDITDLDLISWVKGEMRIKLDEERARAYIFGDGRSVTDSDRIDPTKIIPVITDTDQNFYAMKVVVTPLQNEPLNKAIIRCMVKGMDAYEGSGNVTAFLRADIVSDLLLMEDSIGHRLYKDINELASAMAVEKVVKVPASIVPAGFYGCALDLKDYNVGTNRGGQVSLFDDFDIDYNKMKYLIETRQSGALTLPHSAVVLAEDI